MCNMARQQAGMCLVVWLMVVPHGQSASIWNFLATDDADALHRTRRDITDIKVPDIDTPLIDDIENELSSERPVVYSLHVQSDIRYRFANTLVTSRLANKVNRSREAVFTMELPEAGFITNFTLHIDDRVIVGEVKEKQEAKDIYDAAVSRGQTAAHISAKPRETNRFTIAVNMAPHTKLTFELTYQELLDRKFSSYVHVINIKPGQVVRDMKVDVAIVENRKITMVKVPPISQDIATQHWRANEIRQEQDYVEITYGEDGHSAFIEFHPDPVHQIHISGNSSDGDEQGIQGQFAVYYDVQRTADVGEVYMYNGYFVHFFAPTELEVVDKHVVFVLDVSGSMSGVKIAQLKEAMVTILSDLKHGDYFNIITFSSSVSMWKPESVSVNGDSILEAKRFVQSLEANGGTNINQAVLDGINFMSTQETSLVNILIFLTDGEATSGVTNRPTILANIRRANSDTVFPIYSLAFGRGADYDFVQKMSLQNTAIARKIYEDSDAALQLKGFYDEISSPLLGNVKVNYLNDTIERETLVQNRKHKDFFEGCEIIICGRLKPNPLPELPELPDLGFPGLPVSDFKDNITDVSDSGMDKKDKFNNVVIPYISGDGAEGSVVFTDVVVDNESEQTAINMLAVGIERMWAYLTIQDLLRKEIEIEDPDDKEAIKAKALNLSLKYKFVTPLTSMVVTLPDENKPPVVLRDGESSSDDGYEDALVLTQAGAGGGGTSFRRGGGGFYGRPPPPIQMSAPGSNAGLPGPAGPRMSHPGRNYKYGGGPAGMPGPQGAPKMNVFPHFDMGAPPPQRYPTTSTTTTTTTTLPPTAVAGLAVCDPVNELPNDRYRIYYDSLADYDVTATTTAEVYGTVYISGIMVVSRSLSFRVNVFYPDISFGHQRVDRLKWEAGTGSRTQYHAEVVVSEYEVNVYITDPVGGTSQITIRRGLVPYSAAPLTCLTYSISTP